MTHRTTLSHASDRALLRSRARERAEWGRLNKWKKGAPIPKRRTPWWIFAVELVVLAIVAALVLSTLTGS